MGHLLLRFLWFSSVLGSLSVSLAVAIGKHMSQHVAHTQTEQWVVAAVALTKNFYDFYIFLCGYRQPSWLSICPNVDTFQDESVQHESAMVIPPRRDFHIIYKYVYIRYPYHSRKYPLYLKFPHHIIIICFHCKEFLSMFECPYHAYPVLTMAHIY